METTAKQISKKIINDLVSVSTEKEIESKFSHEEKTYYELIKSFGGAYVSNVIEIAEEKKVLSVDITQNELKSKIKKLQLDPRWKIITYGSLMSILKEHNLVMGGLNNYIKEIPKDNAKAMMEYATTQRTDKYLVAYDALFNVHEHYVQDAKSMKFFVCASIDNFKKENRHQIGQELVYENSLKQPKFEITFPDPDPIIVAPLILKCGGKQFLLLDVVTSWDREAGLIVNEINN